MNALFRAEAIAFKRSKNAELAFWPQLSATLVLSTAALACVTLACLIFLQLPTGTVVPGETTLSDDVVSLKAPSAGLLRNVSVGPNDEIEEGHVLAVIARERAAGAVTSEQMLELEELGYKAESARATANAIAHEMEVAQNAADAEAREIRAEIRKNEVVATSITSRLNEETLELERLKALLARHLTTRDRAVQQERIVADLEAKNGEFSAERRVLQASLSKVQLNAKVRILQLKNQSESKALEATTLAVGKKRVQSSYDVPVNSPVDGVVIATPASVGDYVEQGRLLVVIRRKGTVPKIRIFFRDTQIRDISRGTAVYVRLESSTVRKAVWERATIEEVGNVALNRSDIGRFQLPTDHIFIPAIAKIDVPIDREFWFNHYVVHVPLQVRVGAGPERFGSVLIEKLFPWIEERNEERNIKSAKSSG